MESDGHSATFELFAHGADIGVRGIAPTVAAAFEQAAMALTAIAVPPALIAPRREIDIRCQAPDLDILFVDWLNALITRSAIERMVFGHFAVAIKALGPGAWVLRGRATGEPVNLGVHQPAIEPKGATVTELAVHRQADGSWLAQCVIDV